VVDLAISFPYKVEKVKDGFVYRPKIPILLTHNGKSIDTIGLIDSGSDISTIPKGLAEYLGLELGGKTYEIEGVGGRVEVVNTFVNLTIQKGSEIHHIRQLSVKVPIREEDQNEDIILGRDVFFNEFVITFKQNEKRIILEKVRR
jgi:hypothetical protein